MVPIRCKNGKRGRGRGPARADSVSLSSVLSQGPDKASSQTFSMDAGDEGLDEVRLRLILPPDHGDDLTLSIGLECDVGELKAAAEVQLHAASVCSQNSFLNVGECFRR